MADQSLVDQKLRMSFELAARLAALGAPLLAAYWEWRGEKEYWELFLVPKSAAEQRELINIATEVLLDPPTVRCFRFSM
jgi:hypothetical protein